MGRPKTPTKVLEARGAFRKHPERKRDGEPEVKTPLGSPPDHLTPQQLEAWQKIAERAPMGVLTSADSLSVELAACMLAEFRADSSGFNNGRMAQLRGLLGSFGMNPSDRAKLSIEKPKDDNPFARFD